MTQFGRRNFVTFLGLGAVEICPTFCILFSARHNLPLIRGGRLQLASLGLRAPRWMLNQDGDCVEMSCVSGKGTCAEAGFGYIV